MPEKLVDEPDDLDEDELEPEGCMGIGWGTLIALAGIVFIAGLAVMGMIKVYDMKRQQIEMEMMRDAAFQGMIAGVIDDLSVAQQALGQYDPQKAIDSLRVAEKGLAGASKQTGSDTATQFVVNVKQKCIDTETKIQDRMKQASLDAQADVADLMGSVKTLRKAE